MVEVAIEVTLALKVTLEVALTCEPKVSVAYPPSTSACNCYKVSRKLSTKTCCIQGRVECKVAGRVKGQGQISLNKL